jgi:hypothetical protein
MAIVIAQREVSYALLTSSFSFPSLFSFTSPYIHSAGLFAFCSLLYPQKSFPALAFRTQAVFR